MSVSVIEEQVPKHVQLREILRKKIASEYKPGDRFYSEPQLITKYNLSNTTVQKAFNVLVNDGLITRIQGKGTFIKTAPVLKSFDVVIKQEAFHAHSYYWDIIRGIESVASENRMHVAVHTFSLNNSDCSWDEVIKSVMDKPRSGRIIMTFDEKMDPLLKEKRPFVIVGYCPQHPEIYAVGADIYNASFQMTKYLIDKGHEKIALVGGIHAKSFLETVLKGYKDASNAYNIPVREDWIMEGRFYEEDGYRLTKILLQAKEHPTAILAGDDTIAVGVIKALKESSLKIPGEIAVAGFNDLDWATIVTPNLTTIRTPRVDMGKAACNILLKLACGQKVPQRQINLRTELVIRDST